MTAAEERRRELEQRLGFSKAHGLILSGVFFVLTVLAIVAMDLLFDEFALPQGWFTAIVCLGVAELLMQRFRFRGTGVESALWLGGLYAWIFGLPGQSKPEALLLFAAASAIAGRRVRNPLIGSLTAVFVIIYFEQKHWYVAALLTGITIAAAALAARAAEWQRPSTEGLFITLAIVSPIAGCAMSINETSLLWAFAYVALAVAEFAFGEHKRDRAALVAGAVSIVISAIVLREVFTFALEWKLIASGALVFGLAVAISRALRGRTRGFVMTPVKSAYEETLRIFGTAALAPVQKAEAAPQGVGSGGSFGGAGSTGDY